MFKVVVLSVGSEVSTKETAPWLRSVSADAFVLERQNPFPALNKIFVH